MSQPIFSNFLHPPRLREHRTPSSILNDSQTFSGFLKPSSSPFLSFLTCHSGVVASYIDLYHRIEPSGAYSLHPDWTPIIEVILLFEGLPYPVLIDTVSLTLRSSYCFSVKPLVRFEYALQLNASAVGTTAQADLAGDTLTGAAGLCILDFTFFLKHLPHVRLFSFSYQSSQSMYPLLPKISRRSWRLSQLLSRSWGALSGDTSGLLSSYFQRQLCPHTGKTTAGENFLQYS
ncbi:hypothetical protein H4582DRAFT_1210475 [Lactarius indigo]|nr:hypothetical protein H4582DRAFT_1210475 [Lactarius indigo]